VARSRNHFCSEKAISITFSECVSVALVIQHAKSVRHIVLSVRLYNIILCCLSGCTILYCVVCPAVQYYIVLSVRLYNIILSVRLYNIILSVRLYNIILSVRLYNIILSPVVCPAVQYYIVPCCLSGCTIFFHIIT
jgi:hypothetical protein